MTNAIKEFRVRAEILHKQIRSGNSRALSRLRALVPFRRVSQQNLPANAALIKRRDCLNVIASELGFATWHEAKIVLTGEGEATNFGTLLYRGGGHVNRWYVNYDEAVRDREATGGFLLAYRREFLVVDRYFIESLSLDPDDNDWVEIGFNWIRPNSRTARTRLYDKLIATLPREAEREGRCR